MAQLTPLPQALLYYVVVESAESSYLLVLYTLYYYSSTTTTLAWLQKHNPQMRQHNCQGHGRGAMSPPRRGTAEALSTLEVGGVATETAEGAMVAAEGAMVATAATTMRTMADGVAMTTAAAAMGGGSAAEMRRRWWRSWQWAVRR